MCDEHNVQLRTERKDLIRPVCALGAFLPPFVRFADIPRSQAQLAPRFGCKRATGTFA